MNKSVIIISVTTFLFVAVAQAFSCRLRRFSYSISKKIKWSKNLYLLDGKRPLAKKSVDKLVSICLEKPIEGWSFPTDKVDWLQLNAEKALSEYKAYSNQQLWPGQKDLFINSFTGFHRKPQQVRFHANNIESSNTIDLEVQTKDDFSIRIISSNYFPVLIPWGVRIKGKTYLTYSTDLTNAVMKFFPKTSLPKIDASKAFREAIATSIIKHEQFTKWRFLEAKGRLPHLFDALSKNFIVIQSSIERRLACGPQPDIEYFSAYLKHKRLHPNIKFSVFLELQPKFNRAVNRFVETFDKTITTLSSHKTIYRFLNHSNRTLRLSYTDNGYFGPDDLKKLGYDYNAKHETLGHKSFLKKWSNAMVLNFDSKIDGKFAFSKWLLHPNGNFLLWRATKNCKFLKPGYIKAPNDQSEVIVLEIYPLDVLEPHKTWFGIEK